MRACRRFGRDGPEVAGSVLATAAAAATKAIAAGDNCGRVDGEGSGCSESKLNRTFFRGGVAIVRSSLPPESPSSVRGDWLAIRPPVWESACVESSKATSHECEVKEV